LEQEAIIQKMVTLIQDVPVAAYQKVSEDEREHQSAMRSLLTAYRQQLIEAREFMREKGETVSPSILQAINIISEVMEHWVRKGPFDEEETLDSPSENSTGIVLIPRTSESAFDELVQLVGGHPATAERLVSLQRLQFPDANRLELIERAIERLLRDRQ
jgi:hypothetical protein